MSKIPFLGRSSSRLAKPLASDGDSAMEKQPPRKVLPVVDRMRTEVDKLFAHYVGPIASAICSEYHEAWLKSGNVGPGGLRKYVMLLSREIPNAKRQADFLEKAAKLLRP